MVATAHAALGVDTLQRRSGLVTRTNNGPARTTSFTHARTCHGLPGRFEIVSDVLRAHDAVYSAEVRWRRS